MLDLPRKGAINLHLGMLPSYRGVFPIFHALVNDEKEIGITVHYMDEQFDNGLIIIQKTISITEKDDLFIIYPRAFNVGAELLISSIDGISKGETSGTPNGPWGPFTIVIQPLKTLLSTEENITNVDYEEDSKSRIIFLMS